MAYAKKMATKVGKYKKGGPTRSQKVRAKSEKTAYRGKVAVDEGREKKATRLLKKAARQETRSIKLEEKEKMKMQKMKKGGAKKKFKAHMMYSKSGKAVKAGTMKKHLELKAKGYNHDKRRLKKKK